jgi:hypothetical protein
VLDRARRAGVYVFASAGNFGQRERITFPGRMATWVETGNLWRDARGAAFSVGSVNANDAISSFTSRGMDLQVQAPGESLATFGPASRTFRVTGTSFADPLAAGAMALAMGETSSSNWGRLGAFFGSRGVLETQSLWWQHYRASRTWCDVTTTDGSIWCHGHGRLDVEQLIRSLPGWTQPTPRVSMDAVMNGNFEAGSTNWQLSNAVVGVQGGSPEVHAFSQKAAARLNAGGSINQTVTNLRPNTTYTITAWAHVGWTGETGTIGVRNHGQTERTQTIANTQDNLGGRFVRQSLSFTTGGSSTSAQIFFNKPVGYGGPMMIDRVSVTQGSAAY